VCQTADEVPGVSTKLGMADILIILLTVVYQLQNTSKVHKQIQEFRQVCMAQVRMAEIFLLHFSTEQAFPNAPERSIPNTVVVNFQRPEE
jgi:hypothetical protein